MPFGITSANKIFAAFDIHNRAYVNFFEIMSAIVWFSYAERSQKIEFLFKMVDWQQKNSMKLEELHELFKWTLKGLGYKAFNSADSDGSSTLDLAEMKNWIELNQIFISFCEKFEPKNKVFYDQSLFDKFTPFVVSDITDDVLDTQSDMFLINKGTFSSLNRLMQSQSSMKQRILKSTLHIQHLKRQVQKQEEKILVEQQKYYEDLQIKTARKKILEKKRSTSNIQQMVDKDLAFRQQMQMQNSRLYVTLSTPASPLKSFDKRQSGGLDKSKLKNSSTVDLFASTHSMPQTQNNTRFFTSRERQNELKKQFIMPKLKSFENKFQKFIKKNLVLDEFQLKEFYEKEQQMNKEFTPLNEYIEQQQDYKQKEKLRKINQMKEVLEFKEKQTMLNYQTIQQFQKTIDRKNTKFQEQKTFTSLKTRSMSKKPSGKQPAIFPNLEILIPNKKKDKYGRKPTLFRKSSMQNIVGVENVEKANKHFGTLSMDEFIENKKKLLTNNYINLRGKVYSKSWVQQMKKFFDMMDEQKKGFVTIDDYVQFSVKFPSLKKISNSLFNHFDKDGTGKITFEDMLISMVPGASDQEINKMIQWVNFMYMNKKSKQQYLNQQENILTPLLKNSIRADDSLMNKAGELLSDDSLSSFDSLKSKKSKLTVSAGKPFSRQTRRFSIISQPKITTGGPQSDRNSFDFQRYTSSNHGNYIALASNGLPFTFITQEMILEFRNIFELYDRKKKGYLSRDEFIKSLISLYDLDKILTLLKLNGYENERQIRIDQFISMVKPEHMIVPQTVLDNLHEMYKDKFGDHAKLIVVNNEQVNGLDALKNQNSNQLGQTPSSSNFLRPNLAVGAQNNYSRKNTPKFKSFGTMIVNMNNL
eukprot:403336094